MADKVLRMQDKALTGNERKQVNSSNVNRTLKFIKQQNIIARGGDPSNASSNGHSAGNKKHKVHKKMIFDNYEQAKQYAMKHGIDPQDIDHDNDEYSISWTEERVSNPSDQLSSRDNPDDMRGNEKGRYLHGDTNTAINSVEQLMDNLDYKKFVQALLNELKEKGYDMQDLYFKNGDFYYDVFDNLKRYGMNPTEALKHIKEEFNEHKVDANGVPLDNNDLYPKGIKFFRADNVVKKGVNDVPLGAGAFNHKPSEDALAVASQEKGYQGNNNGEENDVEKEIEANEEHAPITSKMKVNQDYEEGNDIEEGNDTKSKSNVKNVNVNDEKFEKNVKKGLNRQKKKLEKEQSSTTTPTATTNLDTPSTPPPSEPKDINDSLMELINGSNNDN